MSPLAFSLLVTASAGYVFAMASLRAWVYQACLPAPVRIRVHGS